MTMPSRSSGGERLRSALTGRFVKADSIEGLVERSSLGTPDAVAARKATSQEDVDRVMQRMREFGGQ